MKMSPHTRLGGLHVVVIAAFATLGGSTSLTAQSMSPQCAEVNLTLSELAAKSQLVPDIVTYGERERSASTNPTGQRADLPS